MEKLSVGSLLGDSVAVAVRRGPIFILALAALSVAVLANTVLIVGCVMSPACLPTSLFTFVASNLDWVIWSGNRVANWLICGFAIFWVLRSGREEKNVPARPPRLRGYGHCVLYLASISVCYILLDTIYQWMAPAVYLADLTATQVAFVTGFGFVQVSVWAYIGARFAAYLGNLVCGERKDGFFASWQQLQGNRRRVFLLFWILEATPAAVRFLLPEWRVTSPELSLRIVDLEDLVGMPFGSLLHRMPDLVEFVCYVVVSNALCAGAILVVYRRMRALRPETQAAVFE